MHTVRLLRGDNVIEKGLTSARTVFPCRLPVAFASLRSGL